MASLRMAGWTYKSIGRLIGISEQSVIYWTDDKYRQRISRRSREWTAKKNYGEYWEAQLQYCDLKRAMKKNCRNSSREAKAMVSKRSERKQGANNPRAKLTEDQVRDIRARRAPIGNRQKAQNPKDTVSAMAKEFGVCAKTISFIASGKLWPHLDREDDDVAEVF